MSSCQNADVLRAKLLCSGLKWDWNYHEIDAIKDFLFSTVTTVTSHLTV